MNYVTTNIRIPEQDYLYLKKEAAEKRKSLSAVIRAKISVTFQPRSQNEIARSLADLDILAKRNGKILKDIDGVTLIREMRGNAKW